MCSANVEMAVIKCALRNSGGVCYCTPKGGTAKSTKAVVGTVSGGAENTLVICKAKNIQEALGLSKY